MKNNKKNSKKKAHIGDDVLEVGKKAGKKAGRVIGEFKEFISRGNVTDMAVGIIVGASFTAIVNSLVKDVITPLMGVLIGGIDLSTLSVTLTSPFFTGLDVVIEYGKFAQSIISFFIIAVCVFFMVKAMNIFRRKNEKPPEPPKVDPQIVLLTEIRDALRGESSVEDEGEQLTLFDEIKQEDDQSENKSSDLLKS